MIELNTTGPVCLQQKSNVAFDGVTPPGYAFYSYSNGGVVGIFRARDFGVFGNYAAGPPVIGLTVQMLKSAPGSLTLPIVQVVPLLNADGIIGGYAVNVQLAVSALGVITSTLSDVANAISAYRIAPNEVTKLQQLGMPGNGRCPIRLHVVTDGTIPSADSSPNHFAGGIDPTINGSLVRFDQGTGIAGGLWTMRATEAYEIEQILSSGGAMTSVQLVNLDDGLGAITGESINVQSIVGGEVQEAQGKLTFDPVSQGLAIQAPAGLVQVWMRRKSRRF